MTSSSPWTPEPDHGPSSPDSPSEYATGPFQGRVDEPARAGRTRPAWVTSPWTWASVGGVVVALVFSVIFVMSRTGPTRVITRKNVPTTLPQPAAPVALPAENVAGPLNRTIDLIPYVDPAKDAVAGNWRLEGGTLVSDSSRRARIGIRYRVPREYDFRVQFTQVDGDNCAAQIFSAGNPGVLVLGAFKRSITGFQQIAGKWVDNKENPTGVRGLRWENGRTHTSVVRVRRSSIEAWLDGKLITAYATDGSDLSNKDWSVQGYALGVGSEVSSTIFHKVELIEVGGNEQASR